MNDELHSVLPETPITLQQLIDQEFSVNKKFVMVDSRAYTQEAFEYVLHAADLVGSLVFVYDLKKIWANGRYFGGDVFQDDLKYFTTIATWNEGDNTGITQASGPMSNLTLRTKNHLKSKAVYDEASYSDRSLIELDYDLDEAVNKDYVKIGENRYNLTVENGQIKLNEYIPIKVTCTQLYPLEYDSSTTDVEISFSLKVSGSKPLTHIEILNDKEYGEDRVTQEGNVIKCLLEPNTNITFTIVYSDGITGGTTSVTQRWGYGIWAGVTTNTNNGVFYETSLTDLLEMFDDVSKFIWVPGTTLSHTESLNQNELQYGLFICPEHLNPEFVDVSTNLTGGWTPLFDNRGELYSSNLPYLPFRTDHRGLGLVKWKIKSANS